jgi:hypothetical protein
MHSNFGSLVRAALAPLQDQNTAGYGRLKLFVPDGLGVLHGKKEFSRENGLDEFW